MSESLFISGEIQADVGEDFRLAANDVKAAMLRALKLIEIGQGFKRLSLIPIVRPVDNPEYGEVQRYHKKRQVFEFRLKISHAAFKAADALGQRRLIVENILRAVDEMKKMRVKDVDSDKLEQAIREVAASHGWLPPEQIH